MEHDKAWLAVLGMAFKRVGAKIAAPFVVPFLDKYERVMHPTWGVEDTTDTSYWNIAFRNSAHNCTNRTGVEYETWSNTEDHTLERVEGFQWRYRMSLDGKYVSFRISWGEPRLGQGKREFYIGWTMNERMRMRLTFFQLRPF